MAECIIGEHWRLRLRRCHAERGCRDGLAVWPGKGEQQHYSGDGTSCLEYCTRQDGMHGWYAGGCTVL